MLRLIRKLPDPPTTTVRVLGVDDFALKKGKAYGTVLIDISFRDRRGSRRRATAS